MANITKREAIKSIVFASITGLVTTLTTSLMAGQMPAWPEIKISLISALGALIAAFFKYLTTNTVDSAKEDIKAAIKPGETIIVRKQ